MKDFGKNERLDFGNNLHLQGVLAGTKLSCGCLPKTPYTVTVGELIYAWKVELSGETRIFIQI